MNTKRVMNNVRPLLLLPLPTLFFVAVPDLCAVPFDLCEAGVGPESLQCPVMQAGLIVPDGNDADSVRREAAALYADIVALLKSVDTDARFDMVRDSIEIMLLEIEGLFERRDGFDPAVVERRLARDTELSRAVAAFDAERDRLRRELPSVSGELESLIDREPEAISAERTQAAFEEMMDIYEELVVALEAVETAEDGVRSYDTLHGLALRLKGKEEEFRGIRAELQSMTESDPRARDLSDRLDAVFMRFLGDTEMESVFSALEPLAADTPADAGPTPEELEALEEYRVALAQTVELFRKIRATDDIERFADELRRLPAMDREFNERLKGEHGERLIESDPHLVRLLEQMGAEQMRIEDNPELRAALEIFFRGG